MSAIEQALRRISQERQASAPLPSVPALEASVSTARAPGLRAAHVALGLAGAIALLATGAGGAWLLGRTAGIPQPAAVPAAPAQVVAPAEPPLTPASTPPATFTAWEGSQEPNKLWVSGQHPQAARLWREALRGQPPTTTALLVADRQTLAQAVQLHLDWASRLPVVVLAGASGGAATWMVLAVPVPAEVERAREALTTSLGRAPAWGSLAHWIATLEATTAEPVAVAVAVAGTRTAAASAPRVPAFAASTAPPRKVSDAVQAAPTPTSTPTPAPAAGPGPAVLAQAPLPAPAASGRPVAPAPASAPATAPTATTTQAPASSPSAASRAIDTDYQAIEKLLARGDYANAREAVGRLEQYAGQTWRTRYLAGVALSGLTRWEEASAALSAAQARNPGHPLVAVYHSVALQEKGDHAQALRALALALDKHPGVPELWLNQGISLQALGQSADASQAYQRFIELSANRADLQAQRTWAQGRIQKSR